MADSYRGRSRGSDSSSGSHHEQYPQSSYTSVDPAQYSYYPASTPGIPPLSYGHHLNTPPDLQGRGHQRTTSGTNTTYTGPMAPVTATASERASKRQRGGKNSDQGVYAQWADVPVQGDPRLSLPNSHSARRSRHGRDGSASSGYNSPGYSHSHSPYGQQSPSIPGGGQSVMRDPNMYSSHSHTSSPEYEGEEEEPVDHGPTELPPRSYSGKSKYDPPKKPGKIPGSAMDYLPILEARFSRLETAIDKYVDYRGQRALSNSILPGMDTPEGPSGSHTPPSSRYYYSSSKR